MIKMNGKTYYTLDESKKISDENIKKSAEKLIEDLITLKQDLESKKDIYV